MIELLTADTPNGKKISIMLEEIKFDYKVTKININTTWKARINCGKLEIETTEPAGNVLMLIN